MKQLGLLVLVGLAATVAFAYFFLTIFVIQPIGALPDGKTFIVSRLEDGAFIDSADAVCVRRTGGVSLLCRSLAIKMYMENARIYLRLPYSEWLYTLSTGGMTYDR